VVQAVLFHPVVALAQTAVKVMVDAAIDPSSGAGARFMLSLQIDVPQSV
jgi:LacI family transcriptional regulator